MPKNVKCMECIFATWINNEDKPMVCTHPSRLNNKPKIKPTNECPHGRKNEISDTAKSIIETIRKNPTMSKTARNRAKEYGREVQLIDSIEMFSRAVKSIGRTSAADCHIALEQCTERFAEVVSLAYWFMEEYGIMPKEEKTWIIDLKEKKQY